MPRPRWACADVQSMNRACCQRTGERHPQARVGVPRSTSHRCAFSRRLPAGRCAGTQVAPATDRPSRPNARRRHQAAQHSGRRVVQSPDARTAPRIGGWAPGAMPYRRPADDGSVDLRQQERPGNPRLGQRSSAANLVEQVDVFRPRHVRRPPDGEVEVIGRQGHVGRAHHRLVRHPRRSKDELRGRQPESLSGVGFRTRRFRWAAASDQRVRRRWRREGLRGRGGWG